MIEAAIRSLLLANSAVAAIVGTRIYPATSPQGVTSPRIVYERISTMRVHSMAGATGLVRPRIALDCFGDGYAGSKALGDAVRLALDGYKGIAGEDRIYGVFLDSQSDVLDTQGAGDVVLAQYVSLEFLIWCKESKPSF